MNNIVLALNFDFVMLYVILLKGCTYPWTLPAENSLCYAVSEENMNWTQALQVSENKT